MGVEVVGPQRIEWSLGEWPFGVGPVRRVRTVWCERPVWLNGPIKLLLRKHAVWCEWPVWSKRPVWRFWAVRCHRVWRFRQFLLFRNTGVQWLRGDWRQRRKFWLRKFGIQWLRCDRRQRRKFRLRKFGLLGWK